MAKLAVDMASFVNSSDEEAFQAIQSGLVGMVQPLRRYGVVLTQANLEQFAQEKGLKQSIKTMSQAQLVALRYAFIMDKTKTAQGDAARTAAEADSIMLRAFEKDIVGARLLPKLISEWREPRHEEFRPRTAYSLLNCFTEVVKPRFKSQPSKSAYEMMRFQSLLN